MTKFTRQEILERIAAGPISYSELAGSRAHRVRMHLRPIIDDLLIAGLIKQVHIECFAFLVLADWVLTDEKKLEIIIGRCRPAHGCMVWTGYIDPRRGPMVRFGEGAPTATRRVVWQIKRGPLGYQQTVRMRDDCEPGCVEYAHMRLGSREDKSIGVRFSPVARQRMARARQRRGKLDWDKVREIRASDEPNEVLAKRMGVSKPTVAQIRRGETWKDLGGMFSALLGRAAA